MSYALVVNVIAELLLKLKKVIIVSLIRNVRRKALAQDRHFIALELHASYAKIIKI